MHQLWSQNIQWFACRKPRQKHWFKPSHHLDLQDRHSDRLMVKLMSQHTMWVCTRLNCPTHYVGVYQVELSNTPCGVYQVELSNTPCRGVPGWTVQHTLWGCTRLNCPTHHVGVYQVELSNTPCGGVPGWTVQHYVGVYQAELSKRSNSQFSFSLGVKPTWSPLP